jgi:hypothetical protein
MRATQLTRALVAPPTVSVDETWRTHLRAHLSSGIVPVVERLPRGEELTVTLPLLRKAIAHPDSLADDEVPFAWKPIFVRRSLGLAVVDACVSGRFRSPAEAADPVASEAVAEWERTGWRTYHWEPWLAGLQPGTRALVLAEAVSWATVLWASLDWKALGQRPQLGGADDQWVCPAPRTVRLKGRSELRVPLVGGPARPSEVGQTTAPVALVSVSGGSPPLGWSDELSFLALVAALRSPSRPVPARVAGLWPDSGHHLIVEIDDEALTTAADRVIATVSTAVDARLSVLERT